ncbi:MAG: hypothetical protein ABJA93_07005 [Sporichthyaceae bacterium]
MGHVTFVHGIGNKPPADALLEQWRVALLDDDGVDLDALGATSTMVYWADLLYPSPAPVVAAHESTMLELEQSVDSGDADLTWLLDVPPEERAFVERLGQQVGLAAVTPGPSDLADPIVPASPLEAVPLPPWLKRRLMRVFLRDVHHYIYDATFSPRPGESHRIRREVRARALDALHAGSDRPAPHVVIGHSLGSVVAYDVLTDRPDTPSVDALITVGSPLGISEVQSGLTPPWTRDAGWPEERLGDGSWANIGDPLDPVCGFDRKIADDFRRAGAVRVHDVGVLNEGSWRHSIGKYLGQPALRKILLDALR